MKLKSYIDMNNSLQEKLDKAYSKIKDMATRTEKQMVELKF